MSTASKPVRINTRELTLPVKLSDAEILDHSRAMTRARRDFAVLEEQRKAANDDFKSRMTAMETGVLLDPPYQHATRVKRLYHHDEAGISDRVRDWALEHGDNPQLRIALCGQDGEHDMPPTWTCHAWRGNSSARSRDLERIWFSPHCLPVGKQRDLWEAA